MSRKNILIAMADDASHFGCYGHSFVKTPHIDTLAEEGVRQTDAMLRTLLDAVRETGDFERTNFVITSDHGQIDVDRAVRVNVLLREHGYIRTDASGKVTDWDAWCFSAGTSAQLRLRDESLRGEIEALLRERLAQGDAGYGAVYTAEELAAREHIRGSFSFMLETDGHTKFSSGWDGSYLKALPAAVGSHGYHPDHGPSPTFLGFGPAFRKGVVLEQAMLTDGAPTYARILGTELPDADGRVLTELLVPRLSDPV